jgi:hypothetical protein
MRVLGVDRLRVSLGLNLAEMFDPIEIYVDQIPFGLAREINSRHEADPVPRCSLMLCCFRIYNNYVDNRLGRTEAAD